ncbi:MAG TPA: hypothetical protein VFB22_10035 [Candidatus Baltobacteraceae bacterium]|nr:hypothetical protein [Candidatus Baltobacteraceae bacterium]
MSFDDMAFPRQVVSKNHPRFATQSPIPRIDGLRVDHGARGAEDPSQARVDASVAVVAEQFFQRGMERGKSRCDRRDQRLLDEKALHR